MAEGARRGRKLLIASLGVAAVSYVACSSSTETSGNLMAPDAGAGGSQGTGGDADAEATDSGASDAVTNDTGPIIDWDVVANLLPPPPADD